MRRMWFVALLIGLLGCRALARERGKWTAESALKARQKQEIRALELKQEYMRNSLEDSELPRAVRIQLRHELKREQRKLRQRQKDERQELKDRERLLKLEMKQSGMQ